MADDDDVVALAYLYTVVVAHVCGENKVG